MDGKTTTFVNILMFGPVNAATRTKDFCHSQLMPSLRQVRDREGVIHERGGNRDGDGLNGRAFDLHIKIRTTNVTRQSSN